MIEIKQLDLQKKIEKGKQNLEKWFVIDKEWAPTDINKFLENSGWEFSYYDNNKDYDYYFMYNGVSNENEDYILIFCWNGFRRTNEICIGKYKQTE